MSAFTQPLDIVNRTLQILELPRIGSLRDSSLAATELAFAYDKRREYELRRNLWRFATRRVALRPAASTSVLLVPAQWAPGTYAGGSIVADSAGTTWISLVDRNSGTPGLPGSGWEEYFGPMVITPWDQPAPPSSLAANPYATPPGVQLGSQSGQNAYFQGELVYLPDGKGGITLFQSLMPAFLPTTPDGPLQVDQWMPGITYSKGQIAFIYTDANGQLILGLPPGLNVGGLSSNAFQSTIDFNTGNQPDWCEANATQSQPWLVGQTYGVGDIAMGSDTQLYQSLIAGNIGTDPTQDPLFAAWIPLGMFSGTWTVSISPTPRAISNQWQLIPGATASMVIPYPLTAGPLDHTASRNAYRLPAGFLREAPADPTLGGTPWLGAPVYESVSNDWTYESDFIVTRNNQPFIYRFVANTTDVSRMDPMFCEGLAASLAIATAGVLKPDNNNNVKVAAQKVYDRTMFEARTVNAIEIGGVKPPVSDYLLVRL